MSQAKTERLVNLTMALLNSRRFMKKSEIFTKVAGYSGTPETKERMFERDKDDLRALGIEIEVASHDPLFEDEPGYRIRPESYQFPAEKFNRNESALIATALGMWHSSELEAEATNASRRIFGQVDSSDSNQVQIIVPSELSENGLVEIARALGARSAISFTYQKDPSLPTENRKVNPFGLSTWQGGWYLVGEDIERNDIRVFKLSRITSKIDVASRRESYEIPTDFSVTEYLVMYNQPKLEVKFQLRKGAAAAIRNQATEILKIDAEWDTATVRYASEADVVRAALWHFDSAVLHYPPDLVELVKSEFRRSKVNG